MEKMNNESTLIEHLENIICKNKYDMFFIIILYTMKCNYNYTKLNYMEKYSLMCLIHDIYMKDETKTDLATFSDIIMNNYKKALNGEITKYNIYDFLGV